VPPATKRAAFSWALASALLAAGCSQSTSGFVACPYSPEVALLPTMMLYPIPGATNVPDDVGIVIYAGYSGAGTISLAKNGAAPRVRAVPTPVPNPLPVPIASPVDGDVPTFAAAFPSLDPASTYTVTFNSGQSGACANPKTNLGSFSTQ
jgi:hypothetical protein